MALLPSSWRFSLAVLVVVAALAEPTTAQRAPTRADLPPFLFDPAYYSSRTFEKKAIMDGNDVAMTFFNSGLLGGLGELRANWPKGAQETYIGDVLPIVAVEFPVRLPDGRDTLLINTITVRGPRAGIEAEGPPGQSNVFWGFEAKPGFAADRITDPGCVRPGSDNLNSRPALSTDPCTWPSVWPDQPTWRDPTTGRVDWNGYFGRGEFQADLETYFWMDDVNDGEPQFLAQQVGGTFQADSTRPDLQSLGLAVKVRGLQWSQFLAKDAMFWLYEVTNTSTTTYPRVAVGATAGVCVGDDGVSNFAACQRDRAFFDQGNRIVYAWDATGRSPSGNPTGYVGFAFLETPGNPEDGIDNDGDGDPLTEQGRDIDGVPYVSLAEAGEGNIFTRRDFEPRTLRIGDPIIIIDYNTYERRIEYLTEVPITIPTPRGTLTAAPGMVVQETQVTVQGQLDRITVTDQNGIDENFNGLIDEDINLHFERRFQTLDGRVAVLPSLRYKNWVGFANDLVTQRAPNGAVLATRPPTRADSLRHGLLNPRIDEIRIDPTDVTQSDQVGLTSFFFFTPPQGLRMNEDRNLWRAMTPGFFTTNEELAAQGAGLTGGTDGNFIFGSGYFRMPPGRTLYFSLALLFGRDLQDVTTNTETVQEIYNRNYRFATPPIRPTLSAVPGDRKVTLYWDAASLDTVDPVLGEDFEGFRIFKSTDPFFRDLTYATDARGQPRLPVPKWQFDLPNGVRGLFVSDDPRTRGVPFPLGEDTGLRFSVVDSNVVNGQRYYYAITAYDRGSRELGFYPAENNFAISVLEDGTVVTGANVVEVIPNAPVAGYRGAALAGAVERTRGAASGSVVAEVLDGRMVPDGASYRVTFGGGNLVRADSFFVRNGGGALLAAGRIGREEGHVFDGIRLRLTNVEPRLVGSTYARGGQGAAPLEALLPRINQLGWRLTGTPVGFDYEIRFADGPVSESVGGFRVGEGNNAPVATSRPANFTVYNVTLDRPAPFAFVEGRATQPGFFERGDLIFIYEPLGEGGALVPTYFVRFASGGSGRRPGAGDMLLLSTLKPFSARDEYAFGVTPPAVDTDAARAALDRIRVVPNPYVAAASWERPLPQTVTSGRGERRIDFTNLPREAHVRVYTVRGALVWEGRHDGDLADGTLTWNLRTREGLEVAYGVYFWHVSSPVGEKTGKLALIK